MTQCAAPSAAAVAARRAMKKSFQTRGILTAVSSGMVYGMYTAFMTYAMAMGIWAVWYGGDSGLSEFAVLFLLSALGAGLTDGCAAIWALIMAALRGKLGDFRAQLQDAPRHDDAGGGPVRRAFRLHLLCGGPADGRLHRRAHQRPVPGHRRHPGPLPLPAAPDAPHDAGHPDLSFGQRPDRLFQHGRHRGASPHDAGPVLRLPGGPGLGHRRLLCAVTGCPSSIPRWASPSAK